MEFTLSQAHTQLFRLESLDFEAYLVESNGKSEVPYFIIARRHIGDQEYLTFRNHEEVDNFILGK